MFLLLDNSIVWIYKIVARKGYETGYEYSKGVNECMEMNTERVCACMAN